MTRPTQSRRNTRNSARAGRKKTRSVDAVSNAQDATPPEANPGDRLLELYAEAERAAHAAAHTSDTLVSAGRRTRACAVTIPEHLWPTVQNFVKSRGIHLVLGLVDEQRRKRTIYASAAGVARILEAFEGAARQVMK